MLKVISLLVMYLISYVSLAQGSDKHQGPDKLKQTFTITATVPKTSSDQGKVFFALYNSEKNFLERNPLFRENSGIKNGKAKVLFTGIAPGNYAIICFHDANGNGRLDFAESGMPVEDYGATNNVFNYGPPQFNDAKFELTDKDLTFEIKFI